jgi:hypothetical protein
MSNSVVGPRTWHNCGGIFSIWNPNEQGPHDAFLSLQCPTGEKEN